MGNFFFNFVSSFTKYLIWKEKIDCWSIVEVPVLPRCDAGVLDNRLLTFGDRMMVTKRRELITQWRGVVRQNNGNLNFFLCAMRKPKNQYLLCSNQELILERASRSALTKSTVTGIRQHNKHLFEVCTYLLTYLLHGAESSLRS